MESIYFERILRCQSHPFVDGEYGANRGQAVDVTGAVQRVKANHILSLSSNKENIRVYIILKEILQTCLHSNPTNINSMMESSPEGKCAEKHQRDRPGCPPHSQHRKLISACVHNLVLVVITHMSCQKVRNGMWMDQHIQSFTIQLSSFTTTDPISISPSPT